MGDETVLASPAAVTAAQTMKRVINEGLQEALRQLDVQGGDVLSNMGNWSGQSAKTFRESVWPPINQSLTTTRQQLDELAGKIDMILADVMAAGGNA